jgi:hypothetical protein
VTTAAAAAPVEPVRRGPALAILALAGAWCGTLLGLVLAAANPIVVNRVQILHAEVVAEGQWSPGRPPQLAVRRVWKGTLEPGTIAVVGALPEQSISGAVIVPLSRNRDGVWTVSGGVLANPPRETRSEWFPVPAEVRPLVYPASKEVERQLRELLPDAPLQKD